MLNLQELTKRLHEENQLVKSEQDLIWKLNEQIRQHVGDLSHSFWITRHHYLNLNRLILNQSQAVCSQRANHLDTIQFVDAYKELGYQESMYGQFIESFIHNPTLAAACLAYGDKLGLEATTDVARTIVLSCYGNNIITEDYKYLLELMETLMLLQLANEEQPRRLLQKGSSAFCVVFRLFVEALTEGKLFLTSALHQPVMEVLMDDELFLETNSSKMLNRLTPHEIEKRFGQQDDPLFKEKINAHIQRTEEALVQKCSTFVNSLLSAMCSFPQSLGWIITRAYHIVKDSGLVSPSEARALCTDFLLQHFVCPTIVNPELYGVTGDVPVSDITRFNLIQIAQVLQIMAHWDDNNQSGGQSFHSRLDRGPMQKLIDAVINTNCDDVLTNAVSRPRNFNSSVLFTVPQLNQLIQFLRDIQQSDVRGVDQSSLAQVLSHLPSQPPPCMVRAAAQAASTYEEGNQQLKNSRPVSSGGSSNDLLGMANNSGTPNRKKPNRTTKAKGKSPKREDGSPNGDPGADESSAAGDNGSQQSIHEPPDNVLIISLPSQSENSHDLLGTLTENEVMELRKAQGSRSNQNGQVGGGQLDEAEADRLEKRSRISLYSGASDMSEDGEGMRNEDGISRTSGSSSIDMDRTESVPPDDVSSIHAVSSHGNQDEDEEGEEGDQESVTHVNNDEALKALSRKLPTSRESIEDKMRKFEIRQEMGVRFADSSVPGPRREESGHSGGAADAKSETWSIDVYASDSEPPAEQESQAVRLGEIAEDPAEHIRSTSVSVASLLGLTRDEDSRSDVWSVEVLPSDSEPPDTRADVRLQELESESGTTATEDALEDNRSRASTPSLSAASGFSGVSGLSLVSDLNQAKAGEEQWASFGKGPNSISPDAEDLLNREGVSRESSHGGGSSNSSEMNDRSRPHSSSPRFHDSNSASASTSTQSPVLMVSRIKSESSDALGKSRRDVKSSGEVVVEKTVAWKLPDQEKGHNDEDPSSSSKKSKSPVSSHPVMDFDEHINTIKRSPFKKQNRDAENKADSLPSNPPSNQPVYAWDEKAPTPSSKTPPPKINGHSSSSNSGGSSMVNHDPSSAFLPVKTTSEVGRDVLRDFDPLSNGSQSTPTAIVSPDKAMAGDGVAKASSLPPNLSPTHAPNYTQDNVSPKATHSSSRQQQQPHSPAGLRARENQQSPHSTSRSPFSDFDPLDPLSRLPGRVDRKKSWWRDKRLPTFGKKAKPTHRGSLPGADAPNGSPGGFPRVESQESFTSNTSVDGSSSPVAVQKSEAANEQKSSPGDDIMQKYMKKVSSNLANGENPDASGSDLNDSQNLSGSTATTAQSPLSDDTVTTATRGASSTSSTGAFGGGEWGATPSGGASTSADGAGPRGFPKHEYAYKKPCSELRKDARRKLRVVLGNTRPTSLILMTQPSALTSQTSVDFLLENDQFNQDATKTREELLSFLRIQHAEALMLQDQSRIAQIHEVTRCVEALDDSSCRNVVKALWRGYRSRTCYHSYLARARQHLLSVVSHLNHVIVSTERDRSICRRYFTAQCVRMFLKRRESYIAHFRHRFVGSSAMDDKASLVDSFLKWLNQEMAKDQIWEGASDEQLSEAESCIERSIFTHIYKPVLFPNGDGDILRDQLFHQHITRLSAVLTPAHPSLQVSGKYLLECPWPSAQREAQAMAARRSPRGKLDAALRTCRAIMHLLKLADENEAPGADDFTPVLVFVLIKANPPHLLSTVQYVNSFLGAKLSGEEAYWWMQFTAATEFIKTIDERK